jgi:hypothetical protein
MLHRINNAPSNNTYVSCVKQINSDRVHHVPLTITITTAHAIHIGAMDACTEDKRYRKIAYVPLGFKFIHTDEYPHLMNIASYIHRLTDEYMWWYIRQLTDEYTLIDECTR